MAEPRRANTQPVLALDSPNEADTADAGATSSGVGTADCQPHGASAAKQRQINIPGYEILEELGRGGMGVVYKARQIAANRVVALKMVLSGGHASTTELARFQREAEAVARLSHANIVQIYEVGTCDGMPYFTLEYLGGGSLAGVLQESPLPPRESAALVEQLARAVTVAHEAGIVHRDLKPANILISGSRFRVSESTAKPGTNQPNESGSEIPSRRSQIRNAKITDFGLAKELADDDGQTRSGAIMGTPSYMAPEQAEGETKRIGPPADIYALGAILYECLTGRPPFRGASVLETLEQVRKQEPPSPRLLQAQTPRDLETIALKCLQKEPHKRYASAGALADDLSRYLDDKPITARPIGIIERSWKLVRRNPVVSSLSAAIIVVLLGGIGGILHQYRHAVLQRDNAEARRIDADNRKVEVETQKAEAERQAGIARRENEEAQWALALNNGILANRAWEDPTAGLDAAYSRLDMVPEALRRWEWHYQTRQFEGSVYTLYQHPSPVHSVDWSPDGKMALSCCRYKLIVWEAATGKPLFSSKTDYGVGIEQAVFDPSGRWILLSGSGWQLIDSVRHQIVRQSPEDLRSVDRVAFSPDGRSFATLRRGNAGAGNPCQLNLWESATGRQKRRMEFTDYTWNDLAFSQDGDSISLCGVDRQNKATLAAFHLSTAKITQVTRFGDGELRRLCWTPDGSKQALLVSGAGVMPRALIFDPVARTIQHSAHGDHVLAVSPDGRRIVTANGDNLHEWDLVSFKHLTTHKGHFAFPTAARYSPDGQFLITGGIDQAVKVWDLRDGKVPTCLANEKLRWNGIAARPDGRFVIAVGSPENGAQSRAVVWDMETGKEFQRWTIEAEILQAVAFSPDGRQVAIGGGSFEGPGRLAIYDALSGKLVRNFVAKTLIQSVAFSADGQWLAAGGTMLPENGDSIPSAAVWNVATGELIHDLGATLQRQCSCVAFHPSEMELLVATVGTWKRCDPNTGAVLGEMAAHSEPITNLAYTRDGTRIISASCRGRVRIWNRANGELVHDLSAHGRIIYGMHLSADGERLFTSGLDRAVRVWDLRTGQQLLQLSTYPIPATGLTIAAGQTLVACREDGRIQVWHAARHSPVKRLLGHRQRPLTTVFSNDSRLLASATDWFRTRDHEIILWDVVAARKLFELKGADSDVRGLCFSDDGKRVAAACVAQDNDLQVVAWETATGNVIQRFKEPPTNVHSMWFDSDGTVLNCHVGSDARARTWSWNLLTGQKSAGDSKSPPATVSTTLSSDGGWSAVVLGHNIRLARLEPASKLEYALRSLRCTPVLDTHIAGHDAARAEKQAYAIWFHLEQQLRLNSNPDPALLTSRDLALREAVADKHAVLMTRNAFAWTMAYRAGYGEITDGLVNQYQSLATCYGDPESLRVLGGLLLRANRFEEAMQPLRMAIALRGANAPPFEEWLLALASRKLQKPDEVRSWRDRAAAWRGDAGHWETRRALKLLRDEATAGESK